MLAGSDSAGDGLDRSRAVSWQGVRGQCEPDNLSRLP